MFIQEIDNSRKPYFGIKVIHPHEDFQIRAVQQKCQEGIKTVLNEVMERHPEYPNLGIRLNEDSVEGYLDSPRIIEGKQYGFDSSSVGTEPKLKFKEFTPKSIAKAIETFISRVKQRDGLKDYVCELNRNFGVSLKINIHNSYINSPYLQFDKLKTCFRDAAAILSESKINKNLSLKFFIRDDSMEFNLADEKINQKKSIIYTQFKETMNSALQPLYPNGDIYCLKFPKIFKYYEKYEPLSEQNMKSKKLPSEKQFIMWLSKSVNELVFAEDYTENIFATKVEKKILGLAGRIKARRNIGNELIDAAKYTGKTFADAMTSPIHLIKRISNNIKFNLEDKRLLQVLEWEKLRQQANNAFNGLEGQLDLTKIAAESRLIQHGPILEKAGIPRNDAGEILALTSDSDIPKVVKGVRISLEDEIASLG